MYGFTVKYEYESKLHRISLERKPCYSELVERIRRQLQIQDIHLSYSDEDDDIITVADDNDLDEAVNYFNKGGNCEGECRHTTLHIQVTSDKVESYKELRRTSSLSKQKSCECEDPCTCSSRDRVCCKHCAASWCSSIKEKGSELRSVIENNLPTNKQILDYSSEKLKMLEKTLTSLSYNIEEESIMAFGSLFGAINSLSSRVLGIESTFLAKVDAHFEEVSMSDSRIEPGGTLSLMVKVSNCGPKPWPENTKLYFVTRTNDIYSNEGVISLGPINQGETKTYQMTVNASESIINSDTIRSYLKISSRDILVPSIYPIKVQIKRNGCQNNGDTCN